MSEDRTKTEYKPHAPQTLDGWYTLHDFRSIDWAKWKSLDSAKRADIYEELILTLAGFEETNRQREGTYGLFAIAGHKADLLFLQMRPSVDGIIAAETALNHTRFADYTTRPYSYVSVVELGSYLAKPGVDVETDPYLQSRLKPEVPDMTQICFYPMNKKRNLADNWYRLSAEERHEYLKQHGLIGRQWAGRVKQIITGSVGLDDWEWGVTLFADDPLEFKKLVYEMRFEEGSARFGEFGPFLVGHRLDDSALRQILIV